MRLVLAALLVLTLVGTATATEYLWFEVVGGEAVANITQGPGEALAFDVDPAGSYVVEIGVFMTDDGQGLRGYGFDLSTGDLAIGGGNPNAGLEPMWTSISAEVAGAGPGTIVELGAFTAGAYPVLGLDTVGAPMIASFDLVIGPGPLGIAGIDGMFNTTVAHGAPTKVWGAYYNEAYAGPHHLPAGIYPGSPGHYADYDFGTVIEVNRIPEPATLVLLGLGAVALLRRR